MTGLFISVDDYLEDPVEWEVERAIKILSEGEDYDYYPSLMNRYTDRRFAASQI